MGPRTAQGYHLASFGFILGEVVRRVTGRTVGQYLRTEIAEPLGGIRRAHRPAQDQHARCAEMVNKPYVKDIFAFAPQEASTLDDHPLMAAVISADFIPDDELSRNRHWTVAFRQFPGTNGHDLRSGWPRSTTRWRRKAAQP